MSVRGNQNLSCFAIGLTSLHDLSLESQDENEYLSFQPWESLNSLSLSKYNSIVPVGANVGEVSVTPTRCRFLNFTKVSNIPLNMSLWFWKCFTFLENLHIEECDSLIYWPVEEFRSLNCLKFIKVEDCPNFLGSQQEPPVGSSITEVILLLLQHLTIKSCPNLVEIPKCSTSIKILGISKCPKLQRLPEWLGSMIALFWLVIKYCESLPEVILPLLLCRIKSCPNLVELPKCSTSIEVLSIWKCPKLQRLPEWLGSMIALIILIIKHCESLDSLPRSIGGLVGLEMLAIVSCPNLAYIPEGMEGLIALKLLTIKKCPKIRVLPDGLLQQLMNLNRLEIEGCPHLERHFRKYGEYRHLISEIQHTKIGKEQRLKDLETLSS